MLVDNNPAPNFNGEVLSALLLPALVDPTAAVKFYCVGVADFVSAIFLYRYIDYIAQTFSDSRDIEFCIALAVKCFEINPQSDCATREKTVFHKGAWPNHICQIF